MVGEGHNFGMGNEFTFFAGFDTFNDFSAGHIYDMTYKLVGRFGVIWSE